jgi:trans-aconitate 2-methyltransferase
VNLRNLRIDILVFCFLFSGHFSARHEWIAFTMPLVHPFLTMSDNKVQWNSQDYRNNSAAQAKWAMETLSAIDIPAAASVLDIGCGDGHITRELARRAAQGAVVGIDASAQMIELAKLSFADVPNLRFEQMDARKLALPERFDIAFSNATLHWFKEHDAFLTKLRAHMNPGGRLHFNFGGKGNGMEVFAVFFKLMQSPAWAHYFPPEASDPAKFPYAFFDDMEYRAILERNGFTPTRVQLIPKDMVQAGKAGLAGWIRTTWMPFTSRVPEELRPRFIDEIVDEYMTLQPLHEDGTVHVKMFRLEATATVS